MDLAESIKKLIDEVEKANGKKPETIVLHLNTYKELLNTNASIIDSGCEIKIFGINAYVHEDITCLHNVYALTMTLPKLLEFYPLMPTMCRSVYS
jgi:hypothetical protein